MNSTPIVLASTSIYRRDLLARLQIPFTTLAPEVDETPLNDELPANTALRLACLKANAVTDKCPENALIIGSDQVASLNNKLIGKPHTFENAFHQLQAMRGQVVHFYTALCLLNNRTNSTQTMVVPTVVTFRNVSDEQIKRYLHLDKPYHCAGSAKAESLGIALTEKITSDDPSALIGLPLISLTSMLEKENYRIP